VADSAMRVHSLAAAKMVGNRRVISTAPVETVQVDPRVWGEVMRLTGGDRRRFTVISPLKVEVTDPLPGVRII
jgi:hypothetical protein